MNILHSDLPDGDEVQPPWYAVTLFPQQLYMMLRNSLKRRQELTSLLGSLLNLNKKVDYSKGVPELAGPWQLKQTTEIHWTLCFAWRAPHLDDMQWLTAKFGAVNIGICMVVPLVSALRNWNLYSFSRIQNRTAERSKHMQVPTSAVRHSDTEIIRHALLTWHKIKCSLTLLDYRSNSPFSHQIIPTLFLPSLPS